MRGQGLGRQKQGIAKPVEARLRGKGLGLGFGEKSRPEPAEDRQPAAAAAQVHAVQPRGHAAHMCKVHARRVVVLCRTSSAGQPFASHKTLHQQNAAHCLLQAAEDVPVQLWKKRNAAQRVRREYRTAAEVSRCMGVHS